MGANVPIHVVKVGGSLLELSDLAARLCGWFEEWRRLNRGAHFVVIVGGGKLVDALREIDRRQNLGDEAAHWLAIDLMAVNTRVVHNLWPDSRIVETWDALIDRVAQPGQTLFVATQFLHEVEPVAAGRQLPANWTVTSDSIAGRLAIILRAEQLVLLKWRFSRNAGDRKERVFERLRPCVDTFFETLWPDLPLTDVVGLSEADGFPGFEGVAIGGDQQLSPGRRGVSKM